MTRMGLVTKVEAALPVLWGGPAEEEVVVEGEPVGLEEAVEERERVAE